MTIHHPNPSDVAASIAKLHPAPETLCGVGGCAYLVDHRPPLHSWEPDAQPPAAALEADAPREGWQSLLSPSSRKAHYIRGTFSLCNKLGFYTAQVDPDGIHGARGKDDCAACTRLVDKEVAAEASRKAAADVDNGKS